MPVEIDGAPGARTVAQRIPIFPDFVAGPPGELISRAFFFLRAIEDIPAGSQHHQIPETGQGETPIMDQAVDLVDLGDIKIGIEPVVGILLPQRFDKPLFFIFPDALLGEVHQAGDLVDQIEVAAVPPAPDPFILSPGHK
jgi:hypothetical protein